MKPKISVIVPVYKVEKLLRQAVDSLLNQTLKELEIILVDDGSPDGSGAICDEYAAAHEQIKVIHKENGGLGFARNSGMKLAQGDYIGFLDSDDFVQPEMYEKLYAAALQENADYVGSGRLCLYEDGRMKSEPFQQEKHCFRSPDEVKQLLLGIVGAPPEEPYDTSYNMAVWSAIYRRSVIEEYHVRFCSERVLISEDVVFNIDFLEHAACGVVLPECLYVYRYNTTGSLSKVYRPDRFQRDVAFFQYVQKRISGMYQPEEIRCPLSRLLSSRARYDLQMDAAYFIRQKDFFGARRKVLEVCNTPELRECVRGYPWQKLPSKSQKLFFVCMKHRLAVPMVLMVFIKQLSSR